MNFICAPKRDQLSMCLQIGGVSTTRWPRCILDRSEILLRQSDEPLTNIPNRAVFRRPPINVVISAPIAHFEDPLRPIAFKSYASLVGRTIASRRRSLSAGVLQNQEVGLNSARFTATSPAASVRSFIVVSLPGSPPPVPLPVFATTRQLPAVTSSKRITTGCRKDRNHTNLTTGSWLAESQQSGFSCRA